MTHENEWERSAADEGTTESERVLTRIARKAFLSLWSYPNVCTDEGRRNGKGAGKELVDLLVVFGNDVLLFSDKDCAYQHEQDIKIAWPRWYRKAIDKSARQLAGAEKFLTNFPNRVFLDKECGTVLPVSIPPPAVARYHLIAVTRGGYFACRQFYGSGSSGSVMLQSTLKGCSEHEADPFKVGYPLENGRFVHIWDEVTANLLLDELDTISDLVAYLRKKEAFFADADVLVSVPGEEELLARYLGSMRHGEHCFPRIPKDVNFVMLPEGDWQTYLNSPQRAAKKEADQVSYMWDSLIEHQSKFIRAGTAITVFPIQDDTVANHVRVLRALAQQTRLARRSLAMDLLHVMKMSKSGQMFARVKVAGKDLTQAFVFLTVPRDPDEPYESYRERRMHVLAVYCHAVKKGMPNLKEAVGIATEPLTEELSSQDFLHTDLSEMTPVEVKWWRQQADQIGILRAKTKTSLVRATDREFPSPFKFTEDPSRVYDAAGNLMNRKQRRHAERQKKTSGRR